MRKLSNDPIGGRANGGALSVRFCDGCAGSLWVLLLAGTMVLSGCGGGASGSSQPSATVSGNWQFARFDNPDTDPTSYPKNQPYGLQGGFLLQTNGSVAGQAVYSVSNFSQAGAVQVCNSGSATINSGTVSGDTVSLTYLAGSQTFSLTGTLSSDGATLSGTYSATQGTASDGTSVCGIGTSASGPQQWTAILVPPLTGTITGAFDGKLSYSPVSGYLSQGENVGASNASVTGTLNFIDPTTQLNDYPCFSIVSVTGQVSGNSVILQLVGKNGSVVGQIGEPVGSPTSVNPVTFDPVSVQGAYILHGVGPSYMVAASPSCPGNLSNAQYAGDAGNICLALNSATACQQPITLSPGTLSFPAQTLGLAPTTQTITLTDNQPSGTAALSVMLTFNDLGDASFGGQSDFNGLPSYTALDNCAAGGSSSLPSSGNGSPFSLNPGRSCTITVSFAPQQSCLWLPESSPPSGNGMPPEFCPSPQTPNFTAKLDNSSLGPGMFASFEVPITGIGVSALQPSTPELDFSAEAVGEASLSQLLSFANHSANPVQILPSSTAPCTSTTAFTLPHQQDPGSGVPASGLQVVGSSPGVTGSIAPDGSDSSVTYYCDVDSKAALPNFQISSDTCTGTLLASQATCSLEVTYVPQPGTTVSSAVGSPGLDYFLELNTLECTNSPDDPLPLSPPGCEIDSGRFPVELKANTPSPLRLLPGAGLDFGGLKVGQASARQTITLLNDPAQNQTVNFIGKVAVVSGKYSETDNCPYSLAPGGSCNLAVTFNPTAVGFALGTLTLNYTQVTGTSSTLGNPQTVYLRGTGQ